MQTTKWGPEGWILFHSVPFYYPERNSSPSTRARFKKFYSLFKDLLPCKYCRISYQEYWEKLDIEPFLSGRKKLFEWTYHLHNLVNKKLRDQGYLNSPDPKFETVWKIYKSKLLYPCDNAGAAGAAGAGTWRRKKVKCCRPIVDPRFWGPPSWDFIGTLIFNYEPSKAREYADFLILLGQILRPTVEYCKLLRQLPPDLRSREHLTSWLHLFREVLNERLGKKGKKYYPSYQQFHNKYESRRAKCAKKSCRIPVNTAQRGAAGICKL